MKKPISESAEEYPPHVRTDASQNGVLLLRPHHLLCTRSYRGRGYSRAFAENMNRVTRLLYHRETGRPLKVRLICSADCICSCCPNRTAGGICRDSGKVLRYDRAVLNAFHLKEEICDFDDLTVCLNRNLTGDLIEGICSDCCWYKPCRCRDLILRGFSDGFSLYTFPEEG